MAYFSNIFIYVLILFASSEATKHVYEPAMILWVWRLYLWVCSWGHWIMSGHLMITCISNISTTLLWVL